MFEIAIGIVLAVIILDLLIIFVVASIFAFKFIKEFLGELIGNLGHWMTAPGLLDRIERLFWRCMIIFVVLLVLGLIIDVPALIKMLGIQSIIQF